MLRQNMNAATKFELDQSETGMYNQEKNRRMLYVKCDCNGENCKINIAGLLLVSR